MRTRFVIRGYGGDEVVSAEELAKEPLDWLLRFFGYDIGREDDLRDLNWILYLKGGDIERRIRKLRRRGEDTSELEEELREIKEIRKEIGSKLRKRVDEERRKRGIRSLLGALSSK